MNDAVTAVLEREGVRYTDLMRVEKDSQGSIVSVEADTVKINALKASVTTEILTQLKKHQNMTVRIPTGTLLNGDLLTGRGPRIPVKISLSGAAATQMSSYFESAGINQTSHRLVMDITVTLYAAIRATTPPPPWKPPLSLRRRCWWARCRTPSSMWTDGWRIWRERKEIKKKNRFFPCFLLY